MSNIPKNFYRGSASVISSVLYTVPENTTSVVTNIVATNTASVSNLFNIKLNGFDLVPNSVLASKSLATFDIKQVISASQSIMGSASINGMIFHISGMEIT